MITTPFSLELTKDEDAKDAVAGAAATVIAGKMKIFLGANVLANRPQVYVGTLRACYRHVMNESAKKGVPSTNRVAWGDWQAASAGNIRISGGIASVTDDDVAVVVSGTFAGDGATHFFTETFNQLMNVLLERTKDN